MYSLKLTFISYLLYLIAAKDLPKKDTPPSEVVIHATNYTSTPSVHYLIDAVDCLKEAYAVYTDPTARAQLYADLFQEKHNETEWNVVVGYSAAFIKSKWYVETSVSNGKWKKDDKDKPEKETLYLIFSVS